MAAPLFVDGEFTIMGTFTFYKLGQVEIPYQTSFIYIPEGYKTTIALNPFFLFGHKNYSRICLLNKECVYYKLYRHWLGSSLSLTYGDSATINIPYTLRNYICTYILSTISWNPFLDSARNYQFKKKNISSI